MLSFALLSSKDCRIIYRFLDSARVLVDMCCEMTYAGAGHGGGEAPMQQCCVKECKNFATQSNGSVITEPQIRVLLLSFFPLFYFIFCVSFPFCFLFLFLALFHSVVLGSTE